MPTAALAAAAIGDRARKEPADFFLHMLVMSGARARTRAEYDALLVTAGFGR